MNTTHLENIWLLNIINNPRYLQGTESRFFQNDKFQECFKIAKAFWNKYSQIPSKRQIFEIIRSKNLEEKLPESVVDQIWAINLKDYDPEWLSSNTEAWIEWKNLEYSALDSINYLKTVDVTPENVKDIINKYKSIVVEKNNLDFTFDLGLDFTNPEAHKQSLQQTFSSGYPFIDLVLGGGFASKSLYVVLGQPKSGKCVRGIAKVRHKATGEIIEINIEQFYERVKKS
jgi:hypothetical protein